MKSQAALRDQAWTDCKIYELLRTQGIHKTRAIDSPRVFDRQRAYKIAYELRSDDRTYEFTGRTKQSRTQTAQSGGIQKSVR